jgi:DNA-binding XRE family transcriptional regulator
MNLFKYLERLKATTEAKTDYAVAKLLGIDPDTVYNWSRRGSLPDALTCFKIADLLGEDRADVLANVMYHGEKNEKKKQRWARVMGKAAAVALAINLGFLIGPSTSGDNSATPRQKELFDSSNAPLNNTGARGELYIMSNRRRFLMWLKRLFSWPVGGQNKPDTASVYKDRRQHARPIIDL